MQAYSLLFQPLRTSLRTLVLQIDTVHIWIGIYLCTDCISSASLTDSDGQSLDLPLCPCIACSFSYVLRITQSPQLTWHHPVAGGRVIMRVWQKLLPWICHTGRKLSTPPKRLGLPRSLSCAQTACPRLACHRLPLGVCDTTT